MFLEAQRIEQRTKYDLEMLREVGYCSGIENYSRHFDGRSAGEPPWTLVDYFPDDFLLVVDESPHDAAADSRHASGRSEPQGSTGEVRFPLAQRRG